MGRPVGLTHTPTLEMATDNDGLPPRAIPACRCSPTPGVREKKCPVLTDATHKEPSATPAPTSLLNWSSSGAKPTARLVVGYSPTPAIPSRCSPSKAAAPKRYGASSPARVSPPDRSLQWTPVHPRRLPWQCTTIDQAIDQSTSPTAQTTGPAPARHRKNRAEDSSQPCRAPIQCNRSWTISSSRR